MASVVASHTCAESRKVGKTESKKEIYDERMLLPDSYSTVHECPECLVQILSGFSTSNSCPTGVAKARHTIILLTHATTQVINSPALTGFCLAAMVNFEHL
jgi:hypothetical protein